MFLENCNQTIKHSIGTNSTEMSPLTLKLTNIGQEHKGKPLYCWFRFEGTHAQLIQVDVRDIRAGTYDTSTQK